MKNLKEYLIEPSKNEVFVIIKPGFLNLSQEIIERIENEGFILVKTKTKKLLDIEAKELYKIHKEEEWYESLWKYMSSDLSLGLLFRYIGDPFKKMESIKDEIRKEFGESDMRNVIHSSDSYEHMLSEQCIYFG